MSAPVETEMNLIVRDKIGLLSFLATLAPVKKSRIECKYYGRPEDAAFYVRIEQREDSNGAIAHFVTAKGSFTSHDGVNQRKEVTLSVPGDSVDDYALFLEAIGLKARDTKTKTRHAFTINVLEVTLDEWNTAELGDRLEIEGTDIDAIKKFATEMMPFCKSKPSE